MYGLYQIVYFTIIDILNTLKSPFLLSFFHNMFSILSN